MQNRFTRFNRAYVLFAFVSVMFGGALWLNTSQQSERLTLKEQVALYHDATEEEIMEIPKYDRPDMAVIHDFNMTKDPSLNDVPVERAYSAL